MPKFSIIIPVYNVAPYLRECLDSVLAQTFTDWEAICVDDGSTDGSGAILDEYAANDWRFRVLHQANAGVGAARNAALDVARGEWICFLDGDDVWSTECLSCVSDVAHRGGDVQLVRFDAVKFCEKISFGKCKKDNISKIDLSKGFLLEDFVDALFSRYAYRCDMVQFCRFPQYIRGEDQVFSLRIHLFRADRIHCIPNVLYGYRQRTGSAMHQWSGGALCSEMRHRVDMMELIDSSPRCVPYSHLHEFTGWFAYNVRRYSKNLPAEDAEEVRACWCQLLPRLMSLKEMPARLRLAFRLSWQYRSDMPSWVLGYLPVWYYVHSPTCKMWRFVSRKLKGK